MYKLSVYSVSADNILSAVKSVKSETSLDWDCFRDDTLLEGDAMLSQVKAVEQMLQIKLSEQNNEALKNEELQTAAEKFLYLTMCPNTIKSWLVFYKDLFQTQFPDQIILTLNRLMKGPRTQTNKYFKELAKIFFNKICILTGVKAENTLSNAHAKDETKVARPPKNLEGDHCYAKLSLPLSLSYFCPPCMLT